MSDELKDLEDDFVDYSFDSDDRFKAWCRYHAEHGLPRDLEVDFSNGRFVRIRIMKVSE